MKKVALVFLLVLGLGAVATAAPFQNLVQGVYLTEIGGNNARISMVYAEASSAAVMDILFTTSDTQEYRLTADALILGTNALEFGADVLTPTWSMDYVSANKVRIADSDILAWGAGDDALFASDGTNLDITVGTLITFGDGGSTNFVSIDLDGDILVQGSGSVTMNDSVELEWGTLAAEGTVSSDGTNTNWTITSGTFTLGDGGSTNYWSWATTAVGTLLGSSQIILNDAVELNFGTSSAESNIASNGTDTTWTVVSGDLVLGTDAFLTRIEGGMQLGAVSTFADVDDSPDVSGNTYWNTGTSTETILDFDGSGIEDGQLLFIVSKATVTYDTDGNLLQAGTTDLVTASGDLTVWIYDGTDWILISFTDQSDNLA